MNLFRKDNKWGEKFFHARDLSFGKFKCFGRSVLFPFFWLETHRADLLVKKMRTFQTMEANSRKSRKVCRENYYWTQKI